ncbi:MAG: outer membrane beta-barrel protein [Candidatus Sulfotelmatobacter sp.]
MLRSIHAAILLATLIGLFSLSPSKASAQTIDQMEIGANYGYVRGNAPPGVCGCFSMDGGSGWLGYNFGSSFTVVGEISSEHASTIAGNPAGLTLTAFMLGPRYSWHHANRIMPFGQLLVGAAHASGGVTSGTAGLVGSENAFATTLGGGVDVQLTSRVALRALQVDYYLTGFANGSNNNQNNLRIGAGIVFSLWRKKTLAAIAPLSW